MLLKVSDLEEAVLITKICKEYGVAPPAYEITTPVDGKTVRKLMELKKK